MNSRSWLGTCPSSASGAPAAGSSFTAPHLRGGCAQCWFGTLRLTLQSLSLHMLDAEVGSQLVAETTKNLGT